ncbi:unnamed protein product [Polarella glacialis]|uniref:Uncharacterized protein n=1 Tax=Polarella glacialis TaxID=89957 RepID=A0A813GXS1_POLGL|nr:unnamed protein product [Polarella glacialis]|mmetsp:Transcript_97282/g.175726  ORF Transcript_97282/g.175726 Transcript_97282/m.175726 type:complete len:370 (-) Transcript_97282:84-1193(-)
MREEEEVRAVQGLWGADWGPQGPAWPTMDFEASRRRRQRRSPAPVPSPLDRFLGITPKKSLWSEDGLTRQTLLRVVVPTALAFLGGYAVYAPVCTVLQDLLDIGNTGRGPILSLLGNDQSQFMQNFLTVNGLLFTILCGNTYSSLYSQQELLFHALFLEVSEAKSLLEQACLMCQGRPFYPKVLESIGEYVENDLRQLDIEPAELLASRPMDDPLEYILYATSVGVPSAIYDTIRDLRQARGQRLGAMQRKLPLIHFVLLYVLGLFELLAFPLLGAGTASMSREPTILIIQAVFFGAMCGAIVMTLQVIYELWNPYGGAYTVDVALNKMVQGLEEELRVRRQLWRPTPGFELQQRDFDVSQSEQFGRRM